MENRLADEANKGMSYYKGSPDDRADVHEAISATAITSRTSARTSRTSPGGMWAVESPHPGMEHYEAELRRRYGARATDIARPRRRSEPVNINMFPNLSLLGNHIQVFEPLSVNETNAIWYGTAVVDEDGVLGRRAASDQCAAHAHAGEASRISAKSTISPISRKSSAGSPPRGRMGLHASRHRHSRAASTRRRRHQGAGDRRDVHARIHPGMETADADASRTSRSGGSRDMTAAARARSAQDSFYITDALYDELIADFSDWQRDELVDPRHGRARPVPRAARARSAAARSGPARGLAGAVHAGMRLLDAVDADGGDPRNEIAITFDDRRRLEDRVYRLRTGYAWSQKPKSRTVRMVTQRRGVRRRPRRRAHGALQLPDREFRGFETRCLSGWCGHRFVSAGRPLADRGRASST